jgi:hypothetical protein
VTDWTQEQKDGFKRVYTFLWHKSWVHRATREIEDMRAMLPTGDAEQDACLQAWINIYEADVGKSILILSEMDDLS